MNHRKDKGMSRYDNLSTPQLEDALKAMGEIASSYSDRQWQAGQDQMHNEINQVIDELQDRKGK
jgi:hypothetical protein